MSAGISLMASFEIGLGVGAAGDHSRGEVLVVELIELRSRGRGPGGG